MDGRKECQNHPPSQRFFWQKMNHFNLAGKCQSDNFKFWLEYCEMVDPLLNFLAAERDSDWELHLETFQEMLAYDRANDHYK